MKITDRVKADFESIYGTLNVLNEDVLASEDIYIRFFNSVQEYENIKDLLPKADLVSYREYFYIVSDMVNS